MPMPQGSRLKDDEDIEDLDDLLDDIEQLSDPKKFAAEAAKKVTKPPKFGSDEAESEEDLDDEDADEDEEGEESDEDSKEESVKDRIKRKAKAKDGDEEEDDEEDEEDADDESSDEEDEKPEAKPTGKLGANQKALKEMGIDGAERLDDDTAEAVLAQVRTSGGRGPAKQPVDQNAEFVKLMIESMRTGKPLTVVQKGEEKNPAEEARAAREAAEREAKAGATEITKLVERIKAAPPEPEYNPAWESSGVLFNGSMYVAPANQPGLQATADKLNAHRAWELNALKSHRQDFSALTENVSKVLATINAPKPESGGLSKEDVEKFYNEQKATDARNEFLQKEIIGKHASWMFAKDADGRYAVNPATGLPYYTKAGMQYDSYCNLLSSKGMTDLKDIHNVALALCAGKVPTSGVDTKAKGGNKKPSGSKSREEGDDEDEAPNRLKRHKKERAASVTSRKGGKAGIAAKSEDDDGDESESRAKPLRVSDRQTVAEMFRKELRKGGVSRSNIKFGD